MKEVYLKPCMKVFVEEPAQMLCASTVINPGEPNKPAGARDSGWGIFDDADDNQSAWDE